MTKIIVTLLTLIFLSPCLNAQQTPFIRLYNIEGKKISKGRLFDTTDTSIILSKGTNGKKYIETTITQVHLIKINRSRARRIMNTTLIVISVVGIAAGIIYIISRKRDNESNWLLGNGNKNKNKNEYKAGISNPEKPLKRYEINNNLNTWQEQRVLLNRLL